MDKKLISLFLVLSLLLTISFPVFAQETEETGEDTTLEGVIQETTEAVYLEISNRDEFLAFAENCRLDSYSLGLVVTLKRSIDLEGIDFSGIPTFSGIFAGNGHTISGLHLTAEGSYRGLFRYLTATAIVSDLTVKGTAAPGGSAAYVGAIAGQNGGTIRNCSAEVQVSGNSNVGGIAGLNGITGLIEDCSVQGAVDGTHFIGGIAGGNQGVIRGCTNSALINTASKQNTVELSDITLDTITDSEASNSATDIGGIAGISSGLIRNCENVGNVGYPHMGYNVGGIAGTQSGHIADCVNRADVQGRKEVGGIVGQMEPASYVEFSVDTLQILKEQLGVMSGLVDKASVSASGSAGNVSGQIGALRGQANTAWEAVETLLTTDRTDKDALLAAQNTLTTTLGQMPDTVNGIAGALQGLVGGLSRDFKMISEHIAVMGETLNNAAEDMGGTFSDISDLDTDEILSGKVLGCVNRGNVLGDLNVGGIAGAMAFENDLDVLEDWSFTGEESFNFDSKVRAVVLDTENYGDVTGGKQNVGGIVGWQSLGLVRKAVNTGKVDGTGADYVGGISGMSMGYIRSSGAKGEIYGRTNVGGIAGLGTVVSDSRAAVRIGSATEKTGAILGTVQVSEIEAENPVSGNYYLVLGRDIGAVDGISYDGQAQPLPMDAFLALEGLPYPFRRVTVRFLFEDGTAREVVLAPGAALADHRIPQVPAAPGLTGEWEGLEEADLSAVMYDMTFKLRYEAHRTTIETLSKQKGASLLLAEGLFGFDAKIEIESTEKTPALAEGETLLACHEVFLSGEASADRLRFLIPDTEDTRLIRLSVRSTDGSWRTVDHTVNGSYIVFDWNGNDEAFALVLDEPDFALWYCAGAGGLLFVMIIVISVAVKRRKNRKTASEGAVGEE